MPRAASDTDAQHRRAKLRPPWPAPASTCAAHTRPESLRARDEQEVLDVLRAQFRHEQRVTSDDVRFVVRAVASHEGAADLPPDFPSTRWILAFKRAHGFAPPATSAASRGPERRLNADSRSSRHVGRSSSCSSDDDDDHRDATSGGPCASRFALVHAPHEDARGGGRRGPLDVRDAPLLQRTRRQQHERRSLVVHGRRVGAAWPPCDQTTWDREDVGSNASSGSGDSENGATTGDSSSSSSSSAGGVASSVAVDRDGTASCREVGGGHHRDAVAVAAAAVAAATIPSGGCSSSTSGSSGNSSSSSSSTRHGYKLSHTVPSETWEKAIVAVEQQGMSLRAAAKVYGVHFAALHRRVKKRAQEGQSSKATTGYFHQRDETGIMRVVVARAELGVLMTFDELMNLVEAAALRKLPDISVKHARHLMVRFQSRNEQAIRHLIVDWPPPVAAVSVGVVGSHYHLEHPGFVYGSDSEASYSASMQRAFATCTASGAVTAAVTTAPLSPFLPPPPPSSSSLPVIGNSCGRPMLPSLTVDLNFLRPPIAQPQQLQLQPSQQQHAVLMRAIALLRVLSSLRVSTHSCLHP
ncbi:unnamed protein product [Hyaloperonospora brassicae]|uniref:HTH psq-type domain-containing protein n=1 Tax=Hyaloperonospora brassicae TaxID=162125 RepID=A0AAV0UEM2_HYABA|nr:unnamed protein product [Hyaloperonospora brassicae]